MTSEFRSHPPAFPAQSDASGACEQNLDSATLFKRHAKFVVSFLYRQGARGADLDDLVQEVFLSAHRRGGYRPGVASPTTFLAHLALQANLKRRRTAQRALRNDDTAALAVHGSEPTGPAESLALKEARELLDETLEHMESGQRAVFILFELEHESRASIAAGLELPLGTVHSRLHTARKTFREILARRERIRGRTALKGEQP